MNAVDRHCESGPDILKIFEAWEKGVWRRAEAKTCNHHFIISINLTLSSVLFPGALPQPSPPLSTSVPHSSPGLRGGHWTLEGWERHRSGASERGQAVYPKELQRTPGGLLSEGSIASVVSTA